MCHNSASLFKKLLPFKMREQMCFVEQTVREYSDCPSLLYSQMYLLQNVFSINMGYFKKSLYLCIQIEEYRYEQLAR